MKDYYSEGASFDFDIVTDLEPTGYPNILKGVAEMKLHPRENGHKDSTFEFRYGRF